MNAHPLVYGYVRSSLDRPAYITGCQRAIREWCAREGWHLGAVFTDIGAALDTTDRIGFRGLLDALALPQARGAVVLTPAHLSPRLDVVMSLVRQVRKTGAALVIREGELPPEAQQLCLNQPEVRR